MGKLIISDMGDVVLLNAAQLRKIALQIGLPFDELKTDFSQYNYPLQEGWVLEREYYNHLEYKYGLKITSELFCDNYNPTINPEIIKYYEKAKGKGTKIVIGSNSFACFNKWYYDNCSSIFHVFDSVYYSNEIHYCKPNVSFFEFIMKKENVSPSETYFIDDRIENIESAKSLGITCLHFLDNSQLKPFFEENNLI